MASNILSKRGKNKVIHDGYLFIFDAMSKSDPDYSFGVVNIQDRCKVRLHMKDGKVICQLNKHSHEASAAKIEVEKIKTSVKKRSAETLEPPTVGVNEWLAGASQASLALAPDLPAMQKLIARNRKLLNKAQPNPSDLEHSVLPESYTLLYMFPNWVWKRNSYWETPENAIIGYCIGIWKN